MSTSKMTLIGLYNYDSTVFDSLNFDRVDKDVLVNSILQNGGEFEVVYSNLEFLKYMIKTWCKKWEWTVGKWVNAIALEYNPIENYDRIEEWTDNNNRNNTNTSTGNGGNDTKNFSEENQETGKSAFDSADYAKDTKLHNANNSEIKNLYNSNTTVTGNETEDNKHSGRVHGNIGLTSSQKMLSEELQIAKFNLYNNIADLFIKEFCIKVYL